MVRLRMFLRLIILLGLGLGNLMMRTKDYVTLGQIGVWKPANIPPTKEEWCEVGGMFQTRTKRDDGSYHKYVRYWNDDNGGYWVLPTAQHDGSWRPNNGFDEWLSPFVG